MHTQIENQKGSRNRLALRSRQGKAIKILVTLLAVVVVVGGLAAWRLKASQSTKKVDLIFATAERGTFIHEVNGKGSAESALNVDVASQVEGQATVIYLIPEGTNVKKGELLVELDSSDVDEKLDSQVVTTNSSRATLNSSRATLRSAEISLEEYVEGTFEQSWMEYENTIFEAEQTRKQQADSARFTERLLNLNYSTELQYEIDKVAEEKAKNSLEVANLKKMTLLKYTSEKQITSLMSDIETARAKVDSDRNSYNINLSRENRYREISANCKIRAPQDGQVVYANQDSRRMSESDMIREGSTVRQRQVLIRLPDKTQMQVKTMINESNIASVKVGMPAKISFDSIPNRVIEGEVVKVSLYPEIVWMSSAKDYVTIVKINEDVDELRAGLTAQVRIVADEQPDVLMVPVHCVTEYGTKTYCITYENGVWGYKEVLLGESNEKQVIILDGLKEGDVVVTGARLYRDNVTFPDPSAPSEFENSEIYQQKLAEAKAQEEKNAEIESGAALQAEGAPGAGGFPGGLPGGLPGGDPRAMLAGLAERIKSGDVPQEMLDRLPPEVLEAVKGGGAELSADDLEEQQRLKEEAEESALEIETNLRRDVDIAAIKPFFNRTVMEMHRELLTAIEHKTSALQARIASRQNAITRRQEEIELLQKTSEAANVSDSAPSAPDNAEDTTAKIERLSNEIRKLRGDSDLPVLERVIYLEKIDWDQYISGNDVTLAAAKFLTENPDDIFDELFPNSEEVDVVAAVSDDSEKVALEATFEYDKEWMNDPSEGPTALDTSTVDYSAFLPLFKQWDTNQDDRLKPTEFVIGFFSDRKNFQNAEIDSNVEQLFAEYDPAAEPGAHKTSLTEIPMDVVATTADKILRERASNGDGSQGAGRGGRRGGAPGGRPGMGMPGDRGELDIAQAGPGRQGGMPVGQEGRPQRNAEEPDAGDLEGEPIDIALPDGKSPTNEPISSLVEAYSVRQAVALYVDRMDFNGDGILQKNEFAKGYHEVKDATSKFFASAALNSGSGGFGPPSR